MPTPAEKKALLFLSALIATGTAVRGVNLLHSQSPVNEAARRALDAQIAAVDSVRSIHKSKRGKKKKATHIVESEPFDDSKSYVPAVVDMDIASAAEIETLRGIGPSLAARIVADRDSLGPFGSLDELQRVKGIGKGLAAKIAPQVTFSLLPRHPPDGTPSPPRVRRGARRGSRKLDSTSSQHRANR